MSKSIEELRLSPVAEHAARILLNACPDVIFLSGRRDIEAQASAMASNVVLNRHWIADTYVDTHEARELQAWVDAHPHADKDELAAGFVAVMTPWTDEQRAKVSKHFSGDAFDVRVIQDPGRAVVVKANIRALPGLTKFLDHEGGEARWHAQFAH